MATPLSHGADWDFDLLERYHHAIAEIAGEYQRVAETTKNFAMRRASQRGEIYPVFRDLFKKEVH